MKTAVLGPLRAFSLRVFDLSHEFLRDCEIALAVGSGSNCIPTSRDPHRVGRALWPHKAPTARISLEKAAPK
jgi:hypothetical protein